MTPARKTRHRRLSPAFLLAFILASVLSVIALPQPAFAGGFGVTVGTGGAPGAGGMGNTPPPSSGDPTETGGGGGSSGGGGSGGQVSTSDWTDSGAGWFPHNPPATIGGNTGSWASFSNVYHYNAKCGGNYTWSANGKSYSAPYLGWTWVLSGTWQPQHIVNADGSVDDAPPLKVAQAGSYSCVAPPKYYDYTLKCGVQGTGYMVGPIYNSDQTATQPRTNLGTVNSAFEQGGEKDPSLCPTAYTFKFGSKPKKMGQYKLVGSAYFKECTFRTYYTKNAKTGKTPPTKVRGCNGPYLNDVAYNYMEIFCGSPYTKVGPNVNDVWDSNHSFTADDCQGASTTWSCGSQINDNPTFAGQSAASFSVLDDGKARRANWKTPRPGGDLRKVSNQTVTLDFTGGSPFRTGSPATDSTQPFFADPKLNNASDGWRGLSAATKKTGFDLSFLAPGLPGHPWTATPTWDFSAQFKSKVPDGFTWDMWNNKITYTLKDVWTDMTASCTGQPVKVNVSRARNSSN